MKKKSFAKLNLMLDVVSRNEDGFHELDMIMVPIDLFDTIEINISEKMKLSSNKFYIPTDKRNTIIKTIETLRDKYGFKENFNIKLVKNTPTRAGMGGGSSNASLVIRMIDEMLNLNISEEEMFKIAESIGSDVPFTLYGKPARVSGVGESIEALSVNIDMYIFIVKPKAGVSTPKLFKSLDINNIKHYSASKVKEALEINDYNLFIQSIGNSLEDAAIKNVKDIAKIKKELLNFGFDAAVMSGAGSTVFGITQDEELINKAVVHFYTKYDFVKKSRIIKSVFTEEKLK